MISYNTITYSNHNTLKAMDRQQTYYPHTTLYEFWTIAPQDRRHWHQQIAV